MTDEGHDDPVPARFGLKALILVVAFYAIAVSIATYPAVPLFGSSIPHNADAWEHLWIMRWYKTCLLEGRSLVYCPEIQAPVGAPFGTFTPMHLQTAIYVPLSMVIHNDAILYNILWMTGLLLTGLGTLALGWHLLRNRAAATLAGLLAMLSTPMMIHACAQIELIYVGTFPLFLVAWMRFVDRPGAGRLATAVIAYALVAMSAAYYMVFTVPPAVLYVVWAATRQGRTEIVPWLKSRIAWLAGMTTAILPILIGLFWSHIWAALHGWSLTRSRVEFDVFAAPLWGYAVPSARHLLGRLLPFDPYASFGTSAPDRTPYIGVVSVGLVLYAAIVRAKLSHRSFAWWCLALLVVLSLGASRNIGGWTIPLPSSILWDIFPPYRTTRVPSRISAFAGVLAAVIAGAGFAHLMSKLPGAKSRRLLFAAVAVLAVADLSYIGVYKGPIPAMPGCYNFIRQQNPHATLLEIPFELEGTALNSLCTYWQAEHRLTTSAGYSGHDNVRLDARIGQDSPFRTAAMASRDYLARPEHMPTEFGPEVDIRDLIWVYLTANGFDYLVFHHGEHNGLPNNSAAEIRLKLILANSKVFEDPQSTVYSRALMEKPKHVVQLTREGWSDRNLWESTRNCLLPESGRMLVYNPTPQQALSISLAASSVVRPREVRVLAGTAEVARWRVEFGRFQPLTSPAFRLPSGLNELTIETESGVDRQPYRLRVASLAIHPAGEIPAMARRLDDKDDRRKR